MKRSDDGKGNDMEKSAQQKEANGREKEEGEILLEHDDREMMEKVKKDGLQDMIGEDLRKRVEGEGEKYGGRKGYKGEGDEE
ncbi:hypothetical protein AX774_g7635, partial [Zancudomyces culisetae]